MDEITDEILPSDAPQSPRMTMRKRQDSCRPPRDEHAKHEPLLAKQNASNVATVPKSVKFVGGLITGKKTESSQRPQDDGDIERNASASSTAISGSRNALTITREETEKEWLMMCIPGSDRAYDLHQLEFPFHPRDNDEFFGRLRLEYEKRRSHPNPGWGKLSPRGRRLTRIDFVKFKIRTTRPTLGVEAKVNPCLPDGEKDWVCTLDGEPSEAPVSANMMVRTLNGEVTRGGEQTYELVPRKEKEPFPVRRGVYGWGLYFVEEDYWKQWYIGIASVSTLVLAYGIRIVVMFTVDTVTGLTVAGNNLMLVQIMLAVFLSVFTWHHLKE